MNKYKYLKISKTKKLRYLSDYYPKNLFIVFLHGFMSDMEGEKPQAFKKYATKKTWVFSHWNTLGMENRQANSLMEI